MSNERELTQEQLAERWGGMSPDTLRVWRSIGKGPVYNKRGAKVTYSMPDILAYEEKNKINPQLKSQQ